MLDQNLATTLDTRLEGCALTEDQAVDAKAYLLNLDIKALSGVEPMPHASLARGPGRVGRSLGSLDFLRHESFNEEQLSRAPDTLNFPETWKTNFGDFAFNNDGLILSRRAAEVLERLEPGIHQLLPLKIEASKRCKPRLEAMGHVLVNVCQKAQAVVVEKSRLKQHVLEPPPGYPTAIFHHLNLATPDGLPDVTIDVSKISGWHLWAGDQRILYEHLFVSRSLKEGWEAAGCGPMAYFPCKTA